MRTVFEFGRTLPLASLLTSILVGAALWGPNIASALRSEQSVLVLGSEVGQPYFRTKAGTVGDALAEAGVEVGPRDWVTPGLSTPLAAKTVVVVKKSAAVTIVADGQPIRLLTFAPTVGGALAEAGVRTVGNDSVEPDPHALVEPGMLIRVVRVRVNVAQREEAIPFATETRDEASLPIGETRVIVPGRQGRRRVTVRQVYEDGELQGETVVAENVTSAPVNQVVEMGTAGSVARGGQKFRYLKQLQMVATGYSISDGQTPGTLTFTGIAARRGVVAIDPGVIPLGSRLYVEGYGAALAADTGSAIQGTKIDLAFDTVDEAIQWGVRTVVVYILD